MADTKKIRVDGKDLTVPADATFQEIEALSHPEASLSAATDRSATYVGKASANIPPMVGSAWGPGGTMIGTGIKQMLKASFPKVFGEPSDNIVVEGGKDLVLNNAIPAAIGGTVGLVSKGLRALPASTMFKNFPATREGAVQEMTKQLLNRFQQPESQILEKGAQQAASKYNTLEQNVLQAPNLQAGMQAQKDLEGVFGKNQVADKLLNLHRDLQAGADVAGNQTYNQISKLALSDLTHVRNWKLAAGPEAIEDLAVNRLLQSGAGKEGALDSVKMLQELTGKNKEIYGEAISPQTMSNFQDLIKEIHSQQVGHSVSDAVVRYSKGRLVWASGLAGGIHGMLSLPGATSAGITLTNQTLARAMSDPETARIVVEAMRTPAMSQKGQIINSVLGHLWKGTVAATDVPEQ